MRYRFELLQTYYRIVDELVEAASHASMRAEEDRPNAVEGCSRDWVDGVITFDPVTGTLIEHHAEPTARRYRRTGTPAESA